MLKLELDCVCKWIFLLGIIFYLLMISSNRVVGCRREVVKVEELIKREKTGVPGRVERDI